MSIPDNYGRPWADGPFTPDERRRYDAYEAAVLVYRDRTGYGAPHCDDLVLHAPAEGCEVCPLAPELHEARRVQRIAYTGHVPLADELTCPAELRRPVEKIHRWPGNTPAGYGSGGGS